MDYGNWGDGKHAAAAYRSTDPQSPDDPYHPPGRATPPGGFRVPGQREHRDDQELARPYVPTSGTGWSPSGGRHRQLPAAADGARERTTSVPPDRWHRPEDRWRPTLDPTDWRYTTGDIGYPYGYAHWDEDQRPDAEGRGGSGGPGGPGDSGTGPAVPRQLGGGDWAGNADTEQWDRPPGDWRSSEVWDSRGGSHRQPLSDTGAWDRVADTGEWPGIDDGSERPDRGPADPASLSTVDPPGTDGRTVGNRTAGFWSGLRLAGDDPRWVATPSSAPRSPAVSLPQRTPTDSAVLPSIPPPERVAPADHEPAEEGRGSVWAALLVTAAWYVVPALVLLAWILTLDGGPPSDCAADAVPRCESARAQATAAIADSGPRIAAALGASAVIAVLLRWASSWRTVGVGLAAAVIGGGVSTLMISVVTGQPLG
ncbi:MAG TPA: hypothetical protein VHN18_01655 [Micromonosporaceae bacterium]|nr:hypothetical protein [Micromonosporaceae bacterium]